MIKYISASLIQRTINNKEEFRALSLAFAVKSKYLSSQLNNFSYSRLSDMFGISRNTAKNRINKLREMGLVRQNGKNLVFLSLQELGYGIKNIIIQNHSRVNLNNLKEAERFLRVQAVYIKQSQIDYAVNCIESTKNAKTAKELRAAHSKLKKIRNWNGRVDRGQSINTVKRVSGTGKNNAVNLLKWGEKKRLLKKNVRINEVQHVWQETERWKDSDDMRKSFFISHGRTYLVLPTEIKFTVRRHKC